MKGTVWRNRATGLFAEAGDKLEMMTVGSNERSYAMFEVNENGDRSERYVLVLEADLRRDWDQIPAGERPWDNDISRRRGTFARALAPDEVRSRLFEHMRGLIDYWAKEEARDKRGVLEGFAFSLLSTLDGDTLPLPPFDLVARPAPEDKEDAKENGENWVDDGTVLPRPLHEFWHASKSGN
jgi:hypothetical protein